MVLLGLLGGFELGYGAIGDGSWTNQASPSEPSAVCLRFVGFGGIGRNRASDLD